MGGIIGAMNAQDLAKQRVAQAAVQRLPEHCRLGVGTGSTVNAFIDALATAAKPLAAVVSSSEASSQRLQAVGYAVQNANEVTDLDWYVDGADEIDPSGCMIKGGGAALTREKIVAAMAQRFLCVVDESKCVSTLGAFPLPVEVIPMARAAVERRFAQLGGQARWRQVDGQAVVTDNGQHVLDVHGLRIEQPLAFEQVVNDWPGVVTVGVFALQRAHMALVGGAQGVVERSFADSVGHALVAQQGL
ncbi:MAG: ribose-5-phosphate isomerase RpiA [Burkholderiaceae bacterium]